MFRIVNKEKILKKIERDKSFQTYLDKIKEVLEKLEDNPFYPLLDIKKLKGCSNRFRVRVRDCRIVYEIDEKEKVMKIVEIARREDIKY